MLHVTVEVDSQEITAKQIHVGGFHAIMVDSVYDIRVLDVNVLRDSQADTVKLDLVKPSGLHVIMEDGAGIGIIRHSVFVPKDSLVTHAEQDLVELTMLNVKMEDAVWIGVIQHIVFVLQDTLATYVKQNLVIE